MENVHVHHRNLDIPMLQERRRMNNPYAKAVVTFLVSAIGALAVAWDGSSSFGDISLKQWLLAALAVLGSTGLVWFTQNGPWHEYIKTVLAFLSAGISSLVLALDDNHITQTE